MLPWNVKIFNVPAYLLQMVIVCILQEYHRVPNVLREFDKGVQMCRDVIVILLGLKRFRRLATLVKLDRFLIKQVLAVAIWTTRGR